MSTILITGASGFVGQALAKSMSQNHEVVCMSRKDPGLGLTWVRGDFASFEDLKQLDKYDIDVVVHLAAVTGGCLERDGMLVNVEGTRCLMRYLIDRGCKKFVLASSIAAMGIQSPTIKPLQLPIPDEHPCLDLDGYGFSKYMMEELTRYYCRQNADIDVINLRLSSVCSDEDPAPVKGASPLGEWSMGAMTIMVRSDAVRAFTLAAESKHKAGVRVMNATGPRIWSSSPTAEVLRGWWGDEVDVSYYEQAGNEFASLYDVSRIKEELGFEAKVSAT